MRIQQVLRLLSILSLATSTIAHADELVGEYQAYISEQDLYNSSGARLTAPWQVVRQDRANYHKFGKRDADDQYDDFFASAKNREIVERLIQNGSIDPSAADAILSGGVYINVKIFGNGSVGRSVFVNVK